MKKILMIIAGMFVIIWAVLFFVLAAGAASYILLAAAGIMVLFRYSLSRVIS
jgi:hypothetical protein